MIYIIDSNAYYCIFSIDSLKPATHNILSDVVNYIDLGFYNSCSSCSRSNFGTFITVSQLRIQILRPGQEAV